MRRKITLTESQLHRVILNTAKKLIREANYHPISYNFNPYMSDRRARRHADLIDSLNDEYQTQDTGDCMDSWQLDDLSSKFKNSWLKSDELARNGRWDDVDIEDNKTDDLQKAFYNLMDKGKGETETFKKQGMQDFEDMDDFMHTENEKKFRY